MNENARTLRWSSWLGWQIESNWTEPWLFVVYVLIKPFTSSLLLVCMYFAVRSATNAVPAAYLPYMYVSNACYGLVGAVTFGMSYTVITDREHYRMLKYIYISPARLQSYFVGRGLAKAVQAVVGGLLNLGLGVAFFPQGVRQPLFDHATDWGWLAVYLLLGTAMLVAMGLILAAVLLNMARHGMFLSEGIAGVTYLLSGAVFPLSLLPTGLRAVGLALPPTYWLEGMRRALLGPAQLASPLSDWSHADLAAALAVSTVVLVALSQVIFYHSERRAWRLGRIEETTGA
jgi:ABC-2 type transport system permease protein